VGRPFLNFLSGREHFALPGAQGVVLSGRLDEACAPFVLWRGKEFEGMGVPAPPRFPSLQLL